MKILDLDEGIQLKLERDKHMDILHIWDTKEKNRVEVRGKKGYETNGYDPMDKLHQVLDRVGKAASVSDLMNGDVVDINPHHPQGARAIRTARDVLQNEDTPRYTAAEWAIIEGGHSLEEVSKDDDLDLNLIMLEAEFEIFAEAYKSEDYHPNERPRGPERKPTMPAGTLNRWNC